MQTRTVVWSLVGLVILAGVIFLLSTRKPPPTPFTVENIREQAARVSRKLDKLEQDIMTARGQLPQGVDPTEKFGAVESLLSRARAAVDQVGTAEEPKQAYAALEEARQLLSECTRKFKRVAKPPRRPGR